MTTAVAGLSEQESERRDALTGRLFQTYLDTFEAFTIHIGDRLGLYRAVAESGPTTAAEIAARSGTHQRYTREWLEQQAVAGILDVESADAAPDDRRYRLSPGHAEVLLDEESLNYLAPLGLFVGVFGDVLPALLAAFRTGEGVSWDAFGDGAREGQAGFNRATFLQVLPAWLASIPDVHARLQAPGARVADIGCGAGWSSIAIARAYPHARVDGFDVDPPSIAMARANAEQAGVAGRVAFQTRDAADPDLAGVYDLVAFFECLHDMSRPVEALGAARRLVASGGAVLVMDERVAEHFTAPGDEIERFFYSASVLCCLPAGMAEQPSAATGTMLRPATLRRYAEAAGFRDVEVLPIDHDFFRFYRLTG